MATAGARYRRRNLVGSDANRAASAAIPAASSRKNAGGMRRPPGAGGTEDRPVVVNTTAADEELNPLSVTGGGTAQVVSAGAPVQVRVTVPVKFPMGLIDRANVAVPPTRIVTEFELVVIE